jgi:hypothetical protein
LLNSVDKDCRANHENVISEGRIRDENLITKWNQATSKQTSKQVDNSAVENKDRTTVSSNNRRKHFLIKQEESETLCFAQ